MKRFVVICALTLTALGFHPTLAAADITAFFGESPTPSTRTTKGIAIGISLVVVGVEFEYAKITEDEATAAPGLTTGMGNLVVMTPSFKVQLYGTAGGGIFHETYRDFITTNFGANVGGGVKIALAGPIRLRLDYRVFNLNGTPITKRVQRFYGGLSLSF